ncbi:hypothetical protein BGZ46_004509 [Entomortierella lignicola]|nr:hypothetical protein BGZ46_004509 [Entomortierella lignicola]
MSSSARHAARILRHVSNCHQQAFTPSSIVHASRRIFIQGQHEHQIRLFSLSGRTNSNNSVKVPESDVLEKPPTTIQPSKVALESPISPLDAHENEHVKPIEQLIAELNRDADASQPSTLQSGSEATLYSTQTTYPTLTVDPTHATDGSSPPPPPGSNSTSDSRPGDSGSQQKKKPSRFWFYLYEIMYWCALGSIPVHLLLLKGETKDIKEKQEWKIGVLTDMRDKLKRGESIEEEEALLSVGMNRSKREEQVDDKYFEELLKSAEKLDFVFGKDKDGVTESDQNIQYPTNVPIPAPALPPPTVPRKPAPPKSEKSYL